MLGNMAGLVVLVRDLDAAVGHYTSLFGLGMAQRDNHPDLGFERAILRLPSGTGFIELMHPTDPSTPQGRYLEKHGEGIYLVTFEVEDLPAEVRALREKGAKVNEFSQGTPEAWVHPSSTHGVCMVLIKNGEWDKGKE